MNEGNGWGEHQKLVLNELERLNRWAMDFDKRIGDLRVDIATLKVKSGMWGAGTGLVFSAIATAVLTTLLK